MLKLGAHESIQGGLHQALRRGSEVGGETVQLWTKSGRRWLADPLTEEAIAQFQSARSAVQIHPVVAHAAYLINIASPKDDLYQKSIRALTHEVERCEQLGIPYLVLHPGAHTGAGTQQGLARIGEALNYVHAATAGYNVKILLETSAGQGSSMGATFNELAQMLEKTRENERLGVCLDTCHIFAAGYDLRTTEAYATTMAQFDEIIGIPQLKVIHLNDSKVPLNHHKDQHAHIGKGHLGEASFRHLLNDPRLAGLPGILETPKSKDLHEDRENLAVLRRLADDIEGAIL